MKKLIFQVSVGKPSKLYTTCINSVAEYCKKYSIVKTHRLQHIDMHGIHTNYMEVMLSFYGKLCYIV